MKLKYSIKRRNFVKILFSIPILSLFKFKNKNQIRWILNKKD